MIYFLVVAVCNSPCCGVALYLFTQHVALSGRELFGVVEQGVAVVVGQHDGSGIYRTRQTTASGFVASGFDKFFI